MFWFAMACRNGLSKSLGASYKFYWNKRSKPRMAIIISHLFLFVFFNQLHFVTVTIIYYYIVCTDTNRFDLVVPLYHHGLIKILIYLHNIHYMFTFHMYRSKDYEMILMKHSVSVSDTSYFLITKAYFTSFISYFASSCVVKKFHIFFFHYYHLWLKVLKGFNYIITTSIPNDPIDNLLALLIYFVCYICNKDCPVSVIGPNREKNDIKQKINTISHQATQLFAHELTKNNTNLNTMYWKKKIKYSRVEC